MRYAARIPRSVPLPGRHGERKPGDCPKHKAWIRDQSCAVENADCRGKVVAAHVRNGVWDGKGMGVKNHDRWLVPLCSQHHTDGGFLAQHTLGEDEFWKRHGKDPIKLAAACWQRSPFRHLYEDAA